ncbi:MAG TPA: metal ABC transporter substrate-binding protein [Solirubrobacterales bacterium]|nr:metal ABC transporter substrate-binding protein [Solirubrobacterales bacterium]
MKSRKHSTPAVLAIALASLALAACGDEGGGDGAGSSGEPVIVATTAIAADVARQVAGPDAEVTQLLPNGSVPHSYSLSASEQQQLEGADLLVYFSPLLEEALPLDSADRSFEIAEHAGPLRKGGEHHQGDGAPSEGAVDPHLWLDPTILAKALPSLADELGEIDPDHAEEYTARADDYAGELAELDGEIERLMDSVPTENRKLVTSHDVLGYFADRYRFEFVGAPFGTSPEAEANAGELAELIEAVEAAGVPAVFAQQGDDPKVLQRVADETGAAVVDDLLLESLSGEVDSYTEMMRDTAAKISDGLRG